MLARGLHHDKAGAEFIGLSGSKTARLGACPARTHCVISGILGMLSLTPLLLKKKTQRQNSRVYRRLSC